jgi:N-acetyl-D-muramate 6-phosphate phosphatase
LSETRLIVAVMRVRAVLFDLDGTLLDSAPGLTAVTNVMRVARGLHELAHDQLRPHAGSGARGMLGAAFAVAPGDQHFEQLRDEFYAHYEAHVLHHLQTFDLVPAMLAALDQRQIPWGIVTNKALRFTAPSVQALGWASRAAAVIGGDSTPHTKPHPAPLLEAARRMQRAPTDCVYVGDDPRDMRAGKAAGMLTLAAAWGYLGVEAPVHSWGADHVLTRPDELLQMLELA